MANEVLHFGGITIRVVGSGSLIPVFKGFDDILTNTLTSITMTSTNFKEPTKLGNINSQRIKLRLSTTSIDEWFKVNNITIWVKPIWTQYPE